MKIKIAKEYFMSACSIKGLSPRTIENYDSYINRFIKFTGDIDLHELDYLLVTEYIKLQFNSGLSLASIATYIRHLKVFLRYCESELNLPPFNSKIKVPRQAKKIVDIYTNEQIKALFAEIHNKTDWVRYRNCSIIALMLDSGLRLNEITLIDISDYDIKQGLLKVHGKGNKERIVPVGKFTAYYIRLYLSNAPDRFSGRSYLFMTMSGRKLSRNAIKLFVQKLSSSLPFNFSCHKLRHNFATNYCLDLYNKGQNIDIYKLMVLLGHEDIKTTRRYLHLANQIIASKSNISHLDTIFN